MLALALTTLTLVGPVDDSRAFLAVESRGDRVRAYVCDGRTLSQWFRGRWDRARPVTLRAGGRRLRLRWLPDGRIAGRLMHRRRSKTFTLTPATGPAGLYDIRRGKTRATWVMLADGRYRGVMVDTRPRKCRPVRVTLADGTTTVVTVCKVG